MKKFIILAFIPIFSFCCQGKWQKIERHMESGVEVVVNHLEPYKVKGELNTLHLEQELIIDAENREMANAGLADINLFDVDSKGNIFFLSWKSDENRIFKFNSSGIFVTSFMRKGQGPGEIQFPLWLEIIDQDEIAITDQVNRKLLILSNNGDLIKEIPLPENIIFPNFLDNGKYLVFGIRPGLTGDYYENPLSICDSEFKEIKELDKRKIFATNKAQKVKATYPIFSWRISKGRIYVGNEERGYEIWVYDLKGELVRKISKEYIPVMIPEEYKQEKIKAMKRQTQKPVYFPKEFPPFDNFFADDEGRLFVMTYEKSKMPDEHIYDMFNSEGIFIGTKSLRVFFETGSRYVYAKAKKNHLYCLRENASGYKELAVYKMRWE